MWWVLRREQSGLGYRGVNAWTLLDDALDESKHLNEAYQLTREWMSEELFESTSNCPYFVVRDDERAPLGV